MLTQCPNCDTTFRVTSEILRVAQGQVCCGRCNTQFDALERLIEEDESVQPAEDPESVGEFETGAEDLQLSEPDLDEEEETQLGDTAQGEEATEEEQEQEEEQEAEEWVELDDIEAEGDIAAMNDDSEFVDEFAEQTEEEIEAAGEENFEEAEDPEEEEYEQAAQTEEEAEYEYSAQSEEAQEYDEQDEEEEQNEAPAQAQVARPRALPAAADRFRSNNYAPERRSPQAAISRRTPEFEDTDQFDFNKSPMRMPSPAVWKYLALPLAFLFIVQVFNQYSARLARNPRFGNAVTSVYGLLGMDLIPDWNLRAYDVKIYRVLGDTKAGTLRVRGSIRNRAAFPQPYPLLKLVLEDRFGEAVGAREFKPTEYLDKPPPNSRMAPQQEALVNLVIVDPGTDAAGSRLDACLLGNKGSVCAEDLPRVISP